MLFSPLFRKIRRRNFSEEGKSVVHEKQRHEVSTRSVEKIFALTERKLQLDSQPHLHPFVSFHAGIINTNNQRVVEICANTRYIVCLTLQSKFRNWQFSTLFDRFDRIKLCSVQTEPRHFSVYSYCFNKPVRNNRFA